MSDTELPSDAKDDLTYCDREPIHILGHAQSHGVVLVLQPSDCTILQVSDNTLALLGYKPEELWQQALSRIFAPDVIAYLKHCAQHEHLSENPLYIFTINVIGRAQLFDAIAHMIDGLLILELEPTLLESTIARINPYRTLKTALPRLMSTLTLTPFCQGVAEYVRTLTGFDRVMVYRFHADQSGEVIAEARRDDLEPYLGLHYPASDIPQQARALYLRNWLRLIPDVADVPATIVPALNPVTGRPLDMSFAVLRSVSTMHIEYLINMGVRASMSISLITDNQLWGLIACHHQSGPKYVPYDIRTACEFLAQVVSAQIGTKREHEDYTYALQLKSIVTEFVAVLSTCDNLLDGLTQLSPNLLDVMQASGAAICFNGECRQLGVTPDVASIRQLIAWIAAHSDQAVFATNTLARDYPPGEQMIAVASGVLAVAISRTRHDYVLWFRPEVIQMVHWAGDPHKPYEVADDGVRLSPRKSFALWKQEVRSTSQPWQPCEIEAAQELRNAIIAVVLRKAEELARLNTELTRSNAELDAFAYIASHDLKEPLRGIHNYASFLLEDYEDKLDAEGVEKLHTLKRLTQRMDALIESLLHYSRVGRVDLSFRTTDLNQLLAEVLELLKPLIDEVQAEIRIPRPLPTIDCDQVRVREVFHNLISNALKYNVRDHRWVEIGYDDTGSYRDRLKLQPSIILDDPSSQPETAPVVLYVQDNGIGIRDKHFEVIFRIFRRLHARDAFGGGTGSGLTIAKKIIERHGGHIWVESVYGEGSKFCFTLQPWES